MYNARIGCMLFLVLSIFFLLSTAGFSMKMTTIKRKTFSNKDEIRISTMNFIGGDRIGGAYSCSVKDIELVQGASSPLPSGIPTYTVTILNACASGCKISNIHLSCGWFSSAKIINPVLFHRLGYDDCLVNNGQPLAAGEGLTFQYANTYRYPLSVSSVVCL